MPPDSAQHSCSGSGSGHICFFCSTDIVVRGLDWGFHSWLRSGPAVANAVIAVVVLVAVAVRGPWRLMRIVMLQSRWGE